MFSTGGLLVQEAKATLIMEKAVRDCREEMMNASFEVRTAHAFSAQCVCTPQLHVFLPENSNV